QAQVEMSGNYQIVGSGTADRVEIAGAGEYDFDGSFNSGLDRIELDLDAADFSARVEGSRAVLTAANMVLNIPVGTAGLMLDFAGDARELVFSQAEMTVRLGGDL